MRLVCCVGSDKCWGKYLDPLQGISWLLLRVTAGLFLTVHGLFKLVTIDGSEMAFQLPWQNVGFIKFVESLGFFAPVFFATMATLTEIFGGLLLALGLFTRLSCAFNIFLMAIITFAVHWDRGFFAREGGWEYPMMWLLVFFLFLCHGGGKYSLDSKLSIFKC